MSVKQGKEHQRAEGTSNNRRNGKEQKEQERAKGNTNALLAGVEAPILPDYLDRKGRQKLSLNTTVKCRIAV